MVTVLKYRVELISHTDSNLIFFTLCALQQTLLCSKSSAAQAKVKCAIHSGQWTTSADSENIICSGRLKKLVIQRGIDCIILHLSDDFSITELKMGFTKVWRSQRTTKEIYSIFYINYFKQRCTVFRNPDLNDL